MSVDSSTSDVAGINTLDLKTDTTGATQLSSELSDAGVNIGPSPNSPLAGTANPIRIDGAGIASPAVIPAIMPPTTSSADHTTVTVGHLAVAAIPMIGPSTSSSAPTDHTITTAATSSDLAPSLQLSAESSPLSSTPLPSVSRPHVSPSKVGLMKKPTKMRPGSSNTPR